MVKQFIFLISISLFVTLPVQAKKFTSQFCEFELPPNWECSLEGSEWVCQSLDKARKKEAIIILAAKVRGAQDTLQAYQEHLKERKKFTIPGGKTQTSDPQYSVVKEINGQKWIDSLHLASEVPGFYTRYLATVISDLGVAVTFSVAKDHYEKYKALFDKIIASLRAFRISTAKAETYARGKAKDLVSGDGTLVLPSEGVALVKQQVKAPKSGPSDDMVIFYLLGGLLVGIVGFTYLKKKKK